MLILSLLIGCVSNTAEINDNIDILKKQVQEIDALDNVSARKYVSVYFDLSDNYYKLKNMESSYENIIKGLRLDSYNMLMQYRAAEYEVKLSNFSIAYQRLNYIIDKCSDKKIVTKAKKLLITITEKDISMAKQLFVTPLYDKKILIIFYPNVEELYKASIISRIEQEFKVTVETQVITVDENMNNSRDGYDDYLVDTVNKITSENEETVINSVLIKLRLDQNDLKTKNGREIFVKYIFLQSGYSEEEWVKFINDFELQYDANSLLSQIAKINTKNKDFIGILAVTNRDIYSGSPNNNFLFGLASYKTAVMSLNRFKKNETNKTIIIKRSVMQAFSSMGHIIGISRCTTPLCARAYPESLAEQDKKNDALCSVCISNINIEYAKLANK
jgi:predicted Zn-dependent protease